MTHDRYDPITLFHWLWWQLRCYEASGEAFEELFKDVAKRTIDGFVSVRPYGRIGDRKCDGLYFQKGVVYQVYSPDEMKQADTMAKIEEDLAGAVEEWGDKLKEWVFVHNVRRGVPPDVARLLKDQQEKYSDIKIRPLSNSDLWEMVRGLPLQQRCEILGAPSGYEDMFLMPAALPDEVRERIEKGRFVVVHDVMSPINIMDAAKALEPERAFGPPVHVAPTASSEWTAAAAFQKEVLEEALARSKDLLPRFAVFSLAPIPLAIHLGYVLSDRVEVRLFQYDRDRSTWRWQEGQRGDADFIVQGIPETPTEEPLDVVVRVSLSATIARADTREVVPGDAVEVDIRVGAPDVTWLRDAEQLVEFGQVFRGVLGDIARAVPNARTVHLFYAGPTGGAITIGRAINPRMVPPAQTYQYDRRSEPRYRPAILLK